MIGVNSNNPKFRQRFTIGHELGHLALHHGHDLILERLVRLNFRDATSSTASDEEEIEANHSPPNCSCRTTSSGTTSPSSCRDARYLTSKSYDASPGASKYRNPQWNTG